MNQNQSNRGVPPRMLAKLQALRNRNILIVGLNGLVQTGIALGIALAFAMLLDWTFGWLSHAVRWTVTLAALSGALAVFWLRFLRPLLRMPSAHAMSRNVDERVPGIEERWSTVSELAVSKDDDSVKGADALIQKVTDEAQTFQSRIRPETIVSARPLALSSRWLGGLACVFVLACIVNFGQTFVLMQRFWLPGGNHSLTQIQALNGDDYVPAGEPLSLRAEINGRQRENAAIFIRDSKGGEAKAFMKTDPDAGDRVLFSIEEAAESFQYRIRSGDGQTPWHSVTVVDRPRITQVEWNVRPPAYSKLPEQRDDALPYRIRMLEGSEFLVRFKSDQELKRLRLEMDENAFVDLAPGENGWYEFQDLPRESFAFNAVLLNEFGLENKNKAGTRVALYEDLPPTVNVLDPTEDIAARPDQSVKIAFEAEDDFGIAKAELLVTAQKMDGSEEKTTLPIDLGEDEGKPSLDREIELDLEALNLQQGDRVSYVIQVTDTKQNPASGSLAQSNEEEPKDSPAQLTSNEQQPVDGEDREPIDPQADPSQRNANGKPNNSNPSSLTAQNEAKQNPNDPKNANAPQRPPHDMAMRGLDAGQCSACQPRNIAIDQWAGTFEGERRRKQEMAIDPVLKQLKELLESAHLNVLAVADANRKSEPLDETWNTNLKTARDHLLEADGAVEELRSKSAGTPYAFIGLQVSNIGQSHLNPARQFLAKVRLTPEADPQNGENLDKTDFHIQRALEMLADLTRTYETIKREQKIADAMQKLKQMHQIFLEDTQALLGSAKGKINNYNRKIAEVDEEFAAKLKELLEQKKNIMEELAKALGEDPRMLRRFLAVQKLHAETYRDQLTIHHRRQARLRELTDAWASAEPDARAAVFDTTRAQYASELKEVLSEATAMHENMETWLPLDIEPGNEQVQATLAQVESIIRLAGKSMAELAEQKTEQAAATGREALAQINAVHESLPSLGELGGDAEKLDVYVANRLEEAGKLVTRQSGWLKIMEALEQGAFHEAAEVVQYGILSDATSLFEKLKMVDTQVALMSIEISTASERLLRIVEEDILQPQDIALEQFAANDMDAAPAMQKEIVLAYEEAETAFDELMYLLIEKMDSAPAPSSPGGGGKSLEDMLAMLENEMKAAESLGIPCRPINISVVRDWMKPGSNPGQGMGQSQAESYARGALSRALKGLEEADRLQRAANEAAKKEQEKYAQANGGRNGDAFLGPEAPEKSWNTLVSQLDKDILQTRATNPPEQYRNAIDSYFRTISEKVPTGSDR